MMNEKQSVRLMTGRIKVHPDGFGFVVPSDGSEDVHVSAKHRGAAMDSDRVEVEWWVGARGLEGRVVKVVERGRGKMTGEIIQRGKHVRFQPDDPRIQGPVVIRSGLTAPLGVAVVAQIVGYPETADAPIEVSLQKILGDPKDPRTEVEKIVSCADIHDEFSEIIEKEIGAFPNQVNEVDRQDRTDLREIPFTTIDPETARDFDDAVALTPLPHGGHRLWVAVADVSHYLRPGTAMDEEAQSRGVSVYLPNRAIPMLPEPLSAHLCSLVPGEDRLAMVVRIDVDRSLQTIETDFCAAVIHSHARLDYPGVAAALGGDVRGKRKAYEPFLPMLRSMDALAKKLRTRRQAKGALDLDLPQTVVDLDQDDPRLVRDVRRARQNSGERQAYAMIEEFMLAANEAVGKSFAERGEETVWRVHAVPSEEKVALFAAMAERYGIPFSTKEMQTPLGLAKVLKHLHGHAAETALSTQLLRTLKQAIYDVTNVGHFGLAAEAYLHFTSPIRRYPDVIVHRLLKHRLASLGKPAGGFSPMNDVQNLCREDLQRLAQAASFCERKAMEVEREVVDFYRAYFMRDRVGDVLEGTVTGVTSFGLFVTMDKPFVEGLVRTDYLAPDDFYDFDAAAFSLVGRHSGSSFSLGDRVKVEILQVSVARRRIELRIVQKGPKRSDPSTRKTPTRTGRKKVEKKERRKAIRAENHRRRKR